MSGGHINLMDGTSSLCKVCNSKYREEIEKKLNEGEEYTAISKWLAEQNPAEKIARFAIANHKKKHGFKLKVLETKNNGKSGANPEQIQSLTDFLDLIIEKVKTGVIKGKLKPTVTEGVKAAEIKGKLKESSKWEKELINFFLEVSQKHGYSN